MSTSRGVSPAVLLAALGGMLGLGSLLLPWFELDSEAFAQLVRASMAQLSQMSGMFGGAQLDTAQVGAMAELGIPIVEQELNKELVGYRLWTVPGVVVQAVSALGLLLAAGRVATGQSALRDQTKELLAGAVFLGIRPVFGLVSPPGISEDAPASFAGVALLSPAAGLWVALLGALLALAASAIASMTPRDAPAPAAMPLGGPAAAAHHAQDGAAYAPQGAYVPGMPPPAVAATPAPFVPAAAPAPAPPLPPAPPAAAFAPPSFAPPAPAPAPRPPANEPPVAPRQASVGPPGA